MTYNDDCDLAAEVRDCVMCYRFGICTDFFRGHPDKISCPDDMRGEAIERLNQDESGYQVVCAKR